MDNWSLPGAIDRQNRTTSRRTLQLTGTTGATACTIRNTPTTRRGDHRLGTMTCLVGYTPLLGYILQERRDQPNLANPHLTGDRLRITPGHLCLL